MIMPCGESKQIFSYFLLELWIDSNGLRTLKLGISCLGRLNVTGGQPKVRHPKFSRRPVVQLVLCVAEAWVLPAGQHPDRGFGVIPGRLN